MAQNLERTMAGKNGAKNAGGSGGAGADGKGGKGGKGGKKKMIIVGALAAVVLLGGGVGGTYFLVKPDSAAAETTHEEEVLVPGDVTALDPITINLADGRYLKLGIALQQVYADGGGHGSSTLDGSKALDLAIGEFSGLAMTDLSNAENRQHYKDELQEKIIEAYISAPEKEGEEGHKQVMGIYLTQFVMQ